MQDLNNYIFLQRHIFVYISFNDYDLHLNLSSNVVPSAKVLNKIIMACEKK
ncbi:hypothetical protein QUR76_08135 [Arcobacter cryaerophilus gv. pseudocryaerophilus]|uniref:Uncharacterized protein n=3 Tax=unclassified Arcobacter TaxID=2593671 RepID=A0AA96L4U2_9BACT|nr:hypothetical protein RMQ67_08130 [Arcobacter sp. AZ-2023]WNP37600.1 hypothetical protein RJG58_08130 [Arcobacter sp. AZ-2023]WNP39692.1 hypothetical protein RMP69_08130 [Arcobacter sp. AZ-2023]WPD05091.1 hypothetical protein QUR76_08135 [Arcobacter sp. DSM 115956]WPD07185.1 hypothetical protein QUR78_08130 [Arcobacter sp. DSM 115955]